MGKPVCVDCGKISFACQETITDRKLRCMECRVKHLHGVMDKVKERQEAKHREDMWALRQFFRG